MLIRSVTRSRCGLVYRPTRRSWASNKDSIIRAVDVLPFVPVTCTTGALRCGSPSAATAAATASSRGAILSSGARLSRCW